MQNNVIDELIRKSGLSIDNYEMYTSEIAKILKYKKNEKSGKIVIVTSMSPTPVGEGKTTTSIGLIDGLNKIGVKTIGALREPSIGPVFGAKGTGSGSNRAMLLPFNKINLHFTGDFHAITTANNLVSAMIDNEIYFSTNLRIDPNKILWKRCVDANDRSLREISYSINNKDKKIKINTSFNITAASDMMAVFCLSNSIEEFKQKIENTLVAYNFDNEPIYIKDLEIVDAIMEIMAEAFYPNLVRTLENNPVILHGGPFANIAHGCSSLISLHTAKELADVVVTEAGFGSDLGLEKFMDITCVEGNLTPDLIILTISLKSILYNGTSEATEKEYRTRKEQIDVGFENVKHHVNHCKKYQKPILIAINHREEDDEIELNYLLELLSKLGVPFELNNCWKQGSDGILKMCEKVKDILINEKQDHGHTTLYNLNDSVAEKIEKIVKNAYGANGYVLSDLAKEQFEIIKKLNNYYICISKNPYSLTCNEKILGKPRNFLTTIEYFEINHAAKLVIPITSVVYRMPGLPKIPRAKNFVMK